MTVVQRATQTLQLRSENGETKRERERATDIQAVLLLFSMLIFFFFFFLLLDFARPTLMTARIFLPNIVMSLLSSFFRRGSEGLLSLSSLS